MITVTKQFDFCYAHRLIGHPKCGQLHGHNGILEVEITGFVDDDTGMIIDFAKLKKIINSEVISRWDHSYLNDLPEFLDQACNTPPTAENMVRIAQMFINSYLKLHDNKIKLMRIRVYETSTNWAEWRRDS